MATPEPGKLDLEAAIDEGYRTRDRENMGPTIEYFLELLSAHPGNAIALLEVAGAYDTAGQEETAETYYLEAFAAGLSGDRLRRARLQYGGTLRNLGRSEESLAVFEQARSEFPESDSLRVFYTLPLHAGGKVNAALAELLSLVADRVDAQDVARYDAAIRGNAEYLGALDN